MSRWGKEGVLVSQQIMQLICAGRIVAQDGINLREHVQPSSIDLPVGSVAYEMQGVVLPRDGEKVSDIISKYRVPHVKELNLKEGAILEKDRTYLVKTAVSMTVDPEISCEASPKSSIGRVDLHTRVVIDSYSKFDTIPSGYSGEIWLYIVSNSFRIYIEEGIPVTQVLFRKGSPMLDPLSTRMASDVNKMFFDRNGKQIPAQVDSQVPGALMTVDLESFDVVGYFAKDTQTPLFLNRRDNPISEFWEPIYRPKDGALKIPQGAFGIFVTKECCAFPPFVVSGDGTMEPGYSGVMMIYDPTAGEFRAHYAGFFDPGFGCNFVNSEKDGQKILRRVKGKLWGAGVLEIRSFEKDRIIRDGDPICRIVFEKLYDIPDCIYGTQEMGSNYGKQMGPRLAKFFK